MRRMACPRDARGDADVRTLCDAFTELAGELGEEDFDLDDF